MKCHSLSMMNSQIKNPDLCQDRAHYFSKFNKIKSTTNLFYLSLRICETNFKALRPSSGLFRKLVGVELPSVEDYRQLMTESNFILLIFTGSHLVNYSGCRPCDHKDRFLLVYQRFSHMIKTWRRYLHKFWLLKLFITILADPGFFVSGVQARLTEKSSDNVF